QKLQNAGLHGTRDERVVPAVEHINLRTYAKGREIQARFDRESRSGEQPAIVMALIVIHMHAVTVHLAPEVMAGPMQDLFRIARVLEDRTRRAIDLPSAQVLLRPCRLLRDA